VLPNLIVIGAGKCGTSSLHRYLGVHPSVSMSEPKELDFFQDADCLSRVAEYERHFRDPAPVRGESSPGYSGYPRVRGAPERMRALIPGARLIYVVRDPVERAVSHYVQAFRVRAEARPFAEAFRDLDAMGNKYVCYSRYATQLDRYLRSFPPEHLLVLDGDALLGDRERTLHRVFTFLGVDPSFRSPRFADVLNTREEQYRLGPAAARFARLAARLGGQRAPAEVRAAMTRLAGRRVDRPELGADLRRRLAETLAPEAERLRRLTGQSFAGWSV
jgi:hypothetical protein